MSTFRLAVLALGLALGAAGCTSVQVAPSTVGEFKLGELQVYVDRDFASAHEAVLRGLKDMKLFQTKDDRKVVEAEIDARDSADQLVIIKVKEVGPRRTSLKIRYGIPGSLAPAQQVYAAIQRSL